jgi:hypothetical protein
MGPISWAQGVLNFGVPEYQVAAFFGSSVSDEPFLCIIAQHESLRDTSSS